MHLLYVLSAITVYIRHLLIASSDRPRTRGRVIFFAFFSFHIWQFNQREIYREIFRGDEIRRMQVPSLFSRIKDRSGVSRQDVVNQQGGRPRKLVKARVVRVMQA